MEADGARMTMIRVLADLEAMATTHGREGVLFPAGWFVAGLSLEQVLFVVDVAERMMRDPVADAFVMEEAREQFGFEADDEEPDPLPAGLLALAKLARDCATDEAVCSAVYEGEHPVHSGWSTFPDSHHGG